MKGMLYAGVYSEFGIKSDKVKKTQAMKKPGKSSSAFRTISEVADDLGVQQHVLRFWESKFSQIRPLKRGGGRRYYRPEDIDLIKAIHHFLYTEGYTIKGVQKLLRDVGKKVLVDTYESNSGKMQMIGAANAPENGLDMHPVQISVNAPQRSRAFAPATVEKPVKLSGRQRAELEDVLEELKDLKALLV